MYRAMGLAHATAYHHASRIRSAARDDAGQGTVEYVGLLLLIGGLIAAVAAVKFDGKDVASTIVERLKDAIAGVGAPQK